LPPLDLDLTVTGFEPGEIDLVFADRDGPRPDPTDDLPPFPTSAVSRRGDLWRLDDHRLLCGDARSAGDLDRLMAGARARMTFTDPPYNVPITGHVGGRGRTRHREFAFASGEMSATAFTIFLNEAFDNIARVSHAGAIVFVCMDWRHIPECHAAGAKAFMEWKNLVVWNKMSPGQGSFYRSQHELVFVFKASPGPHRNSFGLGALGRTRSNVWSYSGANGFHAGRKAELAMHPTIKPIGLVMDAMRDCSLKGDSVLDPFLGSGTTLLAAERLGRRAFGVEYDPIYIDVTIRRWQELTRSEAVLEGDGRTWKDISAERTGDAVCETPPPGDRREAMPKDARHPGQRNRPRRGSVSAPERIAMDADQ
jgi:DNA modification methylase